MGLLKKMEKFKPTRLAELDTNAPSNCIYKIIKLFGEIKEVQ